MPRGREPPSLIEFCHSDSAAFERKQMKKILTLVAVASAMALVVGTGSAVNAAPKALKIELISKGETHQFWQAVKKGAEDQAKKMKNVSIHFQGPATETMIDKQLEMLDAAIALKPDAIGYAALGTTESVSHLAAAKKRVSQYTCSIQLQAVRASLARSQSAHLALLTQTA